MASHGVPRVSGAAAQKSEKAVAEEKRQIAEYKALEHEVTSKIREKDFSNDTLQLTSRLLMRNPEYYTIWNHRRLILQDVFAKELASSPSTATADQAGTATDADSNPSATPSASAGDIAAAQKAGLTLAQQEISLLIKEDLQFLIPLLKQFPKCYWIWNHRAWLLATATSHLPSSTAITLWQGELGLVSKMLSLDSRNFHGWGYRRIAVHNIETLSKASMSESEFIYTTKMITSNLSNFSAWHNRGQLLPRLLNERKADTAARRKVFDEELELITRALYTDPYDQSLWFYHQYLMSALDEGNPKAPVLLDPCTDEERRGYLQQEIESVKEMLDGAEDSKYIYQALLAYVPRLEQITGEERREEMKSWLGELRKIDPLREGRWKDLERSLRLE